MERQIETKYFFFGQTFFSGNLGQMSSKYKLVTGKRNEFAGPEMYGSVPVQMDSRV